MSHLKTIISNCGILTSFMLEGLFLKQAVELKKAVPIGSLVIMYIKKDLHTPMIWRAEFRNNGFELDAQTTNKIISHNLYKKFNKTHEVYCYRRKI